MSHSTTEVAQAAAPVAQAGLIGRFLSKSIIPRTAVGRRFAFIATIDSLGSGMYYAGSALFFTRVVGLSVGQVGIGLSLAGLVGFLGVVPLGMLADRVRAGRIYVALQLWRAAGFAAYCLAGSFPVFVAIACAIGLADAAVPPISQAVVGAAVSSEDRVDTLAKIRAVRNVGFSLGALVAAGAIQYGSRAAFVFLIAGNAVSFLVAALMLWSARVTRLITVGKSAKGTRPTLVADVRYIAAAVLNGVLSVHLVLLPLALPLWIAMHTKVPIGIFGILFMLNTVMAVLLQARFARSADKLRGAVACAVLAGASLAAFGVIAYVMGQVHLVVLAIVLAVVAAVLITFGEMWQSAAGWTISYELARPERRAQYLSTFQMGTVVQAAAAPWVLTHLVMPNPHGWLIFAAVIAVAGLAMAIVIDIPGRRRVSVTMGAATGGLAAALCGGIAAGVLLFAPNHLVHAPNPIGPATSSSPYSSRSSSPPGPRTPAGPRVPPKVPSGPPSDPSGRHSGRPSGRHSGRHSGRPSGLPSGLPSDLPSGLPSDLPSGLLSNLPLGPALEPALGPALEPALGPTVNCAGGDQHAPDITAYGTHHLTWKGVRDVSYLNPKYSGDDGEVSAIFRPADQPYDLEMSKGGTQVHYLASGASTKGEFGLYRWDFSGRRSGPDPHFHKTASESFFILSGTVKLYDGRRWAAAKPGDFLFVPEGGIHGFRNESGEPASMLLLVAPAAAREGYFETLAEWATTGKEPDAKERTEFMIRHDNYFI